ncbi:MAG: 4-(cytidine 5'-diphospho)-2-C-methyl-D-erythritol kinase [Cyclobacteriaceae bacterium]|nr:4-(cytidine 5'-diphospho)-2-C-methyl-D-erythritol kinase [Cyclobacteriaceae bacterium]
MLVFPNAKINLGLNIISRRPDGYHELETCFYPVMWQEALEITEAETLKMTVTGIDVPGEDDNIVLKAYHLLAKEHQMPPVQIHLHKAIPIGAGLGGGSADAAFALKLLNSLFSLSLTDTQLMQAALKLGADCPFFVKNKAMLASGIGEQLTSTSLSLDGYYMVLVYPDIHISTREAYAGVHPQKPQVGIKHIVEETPISQWKTLLVNDFEKNLFEKYPVLAKIKTKLYDAGALYAAMSGSGSCIYGIFDEEPFPTFPHTYQLWKGML